MDINWKQAKKDLKALGIRVNTSIKGCCPGCVENSPFTDEEPAIFQLRNRWDGWNGGYLNHQNIVSSGLADKVTEVLTKNKIKWEWDGSNAYSIYVEFVDEVN